ncbi:thiolase family protein [Caldimonas sp.]|uniref:thiolase family protein n=1 Tax=Caldimonas sp. TaxID=2838790 RepID=UPI00391BA5C2
MSRGLYQCFDDVWLLDGLRTPLVDYCGAFAGVSPTDLGIKVAREVLARTGVAGDAVDSVLVGNVAPGDADHFFLPRHVGLYAGVPIEVPALLVQRICGTGFELFRQAAEQISAGVASTVLVVGTESMTRHPISAFEHRQGFRLGAPLGFKDTLWESLNDTAVGASMIQTAENLARRYGITREEVDAFASRSFGRAVAAQESGWLAGEIVSVTHERFEREGCLPRGIRLQGEAAVIDRDTHPRRSPPQVLARLRTIYPGGVQTAGNSSALTDAAAAAVVTSGPALQGRRPLGRIAAAAVVGVPPEIMGIGPAPAIRLLLECRGLHVHDIARVEVNEAQAAQALAVQRELDLDLERLNVHGGAIALGHPLAATGVRLAVTVARQLRAIGARHGIASACVGGGQGMALLIENPDA